MSVSPAPASVIVCGQIADTEFAAKARAGHADDIRLCPSCNQECVGRIGLNRWLGCIENPRTGRESTPLAPPVRSRREVMAVGAGPAGLQERGLPFDTPQESAALAQVMLARFPADEYPHLAEFIFGHMALPRRQNCNAGVVAENAATSPKS
jgi:hypothetical protein